MFPNLPNQESRHWLENGRDAVCGDVAALGTPFMSETSCAICRTIIELKIDLVGLQPRLRERLRTGPVMGDGSDIPIYEVSGNPHEEQHDEVRA